MNIEIKIILNEIIDSIIINETNQKININLSKNISLYSKIPNFF